MKHLALFLALSIAVPAAFMAEPSSDPCDDSPPATHAAAQSVVPGAAALRTRVPDYGRLPIRFEPNIGQAPPQVQYLARGGGYSMALSGEGLTLALRHGAQAGAGAPAAARLRLRLVQARSGAAPRGGQRQDSVSNYFIGRDPSRWRARVPNYAAVRYDQVYPGIDWLFYGNPRQLEYDFVVAPRSDPRQIRLKIDGADALTLSREGDLLIRTHGEVISQLRPIVYQSAEGGARRRIEGRYVLDHGMVSFTLGDYDHSRELIIDPSLVYSTYLGASWSDEAAAIATDAQGNAYIVGNTWSALFPVEQPLQGTNLEYNKFATAFIAKLNPGGTALVYSTYLGGSGSDRSGNLGLCGPGGSGNFGRGATAEGNGGDGATAVAVDAAGNSYVAGYTSSSDFPTRAPLQGVNRAATNHGSNAFLAKLNAAGDALVYSTYLGGSGINGALTTGDSAAGVAVDAAGDAYITGITTSADFPTHMPFQATNQEPMSSGRPTGFVAEINAAGSALVYSSYLGGTGGLGGLGDCPNAIAVDAAGHAYLAGQTSSTDFPTAAALQPVNHAVAGLGDAFGSGTAFLARVDVGGAALTYSTYLGGSGTDSALGVAVDASGDAYVTGYTSSEDFPVANAFQPQNATGGHGTSAFVSKLNPFGSALIYSTYLGGSTDDQGNAIALDAAGKAYVAGYTYSTDLPVVNPVQAVNNGGAHTASNAFISVLDPTGASLTFSTYLGGSGYPIPIACPVSVHPCPTVYTGDSAAAIAVDGTGNILVTGLTPSSDFPTAAALQTKPTGLFVAKISPGQVTEPATGGGGAVGGWLIGFLGLSLAVRYLTRRGPARH
jgi:hypothetical protein